MPDTLPNLRSESRIPASVWIFSIGASLIALPMLFFTDILLVVLGCLVLLVVAISADERYRVFLLVALIPLAHAGIGWSELGGFGPYDIFLAWFILLHLWRVVPLTLFQVELPRPIWMGGVMVLTFVPSIIHSGVSTETAKAFLQLFASILTAAGVYDILRRRGDVLLMRKLLILFVGVAAGVSLYGLFQTVISGSIVNVAVGRAYFGLFQDVNYYSGYLLMALAIAIGLMMSARQFIPRMLFLGSTAVLTIATIATVSRSAIAAFILLVLAYVTYFVLQRGVQKWMGAIMIAGVVAIMGLVIFTDLGKKMVDLFTLSRRIETVLEGRDASLQQRANILGVTMRMIESNPIVGVGFGSFEGTFGRYQETFLSTGFKRSAHNTYLRVAAETGVIGTSGLVLFLASLMLNVLRGVRSALPGPSRAVFLSLAFSLSTFLLMSATLDQMFEPHFWIVAGITLAYGSIHVRQSASHDSQFNTSDA